MTIQGQGIQKRNQNLNTSLLRLNWKANLTSYKCGEKGYLARECPHTGNAATVQSQSSQTIMTSQITHSGPTLLPAIHLTLSPTITTETHISAELWQILRDQLIKVNQDNLPLEKVVKKRVQQIETNTLKSKTPTGDANTKTNKIGQAKWNNKGLTEIEILRLPCRPLQLATAKRVIQQRQ